MIDKYKQLKYPLKPTQVCSRCVMDDTDPLISFDPSSVCNYCNAYCQKRAAFVPEENARAGQIERMIDTCKKAGKGKKYDCVIGVSGGVDSTYVAWLVKSYGLRPLAVHLDNGWNSELAISNISNVLRKLEIELHTYVLDWETFRALQLAFLKASTPDSEIPSDHAIVALMRSIAAEEGVPVIWGVNFSSESVLPVSWSQGHMDWGYIKKVNQLFGGKSLKNYPHYSVWKLIYYNRIIRQKLFNILNYIDYNKEEAKTFLANETGWRDYGGKHYESVYTRIFQSYILPEKFGFDKRKAHYSSLIMAGQLSRENALEMLKEPLVNHTTINKDIDYLVKKLQITRDEFNKIMLLPPRAYHEFSPRWPHLVKKIESHFFRQFFKARRSVIGQFRKPA